MTDDTKTTITAPADAANPEVGMRVQFANGGQADVHWVRDGWVGYALYYPNSDEPILQRRTIANWAESIQHTARKIALEQAYG